MRIRDPKTTALIFASGKMVHQLSHVSHDADAQPCLAAVLLTVGDARRSALAQRTRILRERQPGRWGFRVARQKQLWH